MGTRADFYVGRGVDAEWIGSTAFDGYPEGINKPVLTAPTERRFRNAVKHMLSESDSNTTPDMGWPWPWIDSKTTDYAYAFDKGKVYASCFGGAWFNPRRKEPDHDNEIAVAEFPDMTSRQNITMGKRSGLIVISR